jgi:hypothetical protein
MAGKAGWLWLLAVLVCAAAGPGCVQRRMTIRSNPPGAMVYIDNQEIGTTPVSTGFVYYGTRQFRLVKEGYETLTESRTLPSPWYQFIPLDFVSENLVPGEIRDHHTLDFQLVPQRVVPTEELLGRAELLRQETRGMGVVRAGPLPGPGPAAVPGRGVRPAPTAPWGSAPPATPPASAPPFAPGTPPPFAPGTAPGFAPGPAPTFAPGTEPSPQPGPSSNELLPYPTEPPGGWQPRSGS